MEIKLAVEILQVAMTIDEARQNGLALTSITWASAGTCFAATTHCLELAGLDNDDGISRWVAGQCHRSVFHPAPRVLSLPCFFFPSCPDQQTATRPPFLLTLREGLLLKSAVSTRRSKVFDEPFTVNAGSVKTI